TTAGGIIFGYQSTAFTSFTLTPGSNVPAVYVGTDGKLRGELWTGTINPITSTNVVNDGRWHHVALVGNSNTQTLYLDGGVVGSLAGTILTSGSQNLNVNQLGLGYSSSWPAGNGNWFPWVGELDDVRVWNTARTQAEIQANMTSELSGSEAGLVSYLPFDEG